MANLPSSQVNAVISEMERQFVPQEFTPEYAALDPMERLGENIEEFSSGHIVPTHNLLSIIECVSSEALPLTVGEHGNFTPHPYLPHVYRRPNGDYVIQG